MIAFKLLGAVLILTVGMIGAWGSVRYEKRRVQTLDGWIDLIRFIRSRIDCYLTPLDEILTAYAPNRDADLGMLLERSSLYLDEEAKRVISGFEKEIGAGYREEQLRICDFCVEELRHLRKSCAEKAPTRTKLSVTLCVCLSLGTAILLW